MEGGTFANWLLLFETGSYTVTQAGLKPLETLLPQPPKCWDQRCELCLARIPRFCFCLRKCARGQKQGLRYAVTRDTESHPIHQFAESLPKIHETPGSIPSTD